MSDTDPTLPQTVLMGPMVWGPLNDTAGLTRRLEASIEDGECGGERALRAGAL